MDAQGTGVTDYLGRHPIFMLESVPVLILTSSIFAFLAGIGVGGGTLLILWLTFVLRYPPSYARIINLFFFLPCAIISSVFRWKQGCLDMKKILPAVISGCIAAAAGSYCSKFLDITILQKLFGILLLFAGFRELVYKEKKRR